ncbi:hypothetical protein A2I96_06510 [Pseudoalteromonas tetraodonis]|jgi:glycosyltransferase involved in cell wall biosynthesis|uniref:Uncharacterized protein n=1 Tax=Pseudoalteromonas tetraodonis TaxID=43659 RepID=A0ABD4ERZ6_9GAMM|nr:glycosyltransferase [Pseudoalteromonas spiralis]KYL36922.1 hypothetical protein A2I96_06510 [Pseudoalteromonas spiralis]
MNIVFLPFHDYKLSLLEGFRTRDAHIYSQIVKSNNVDNVVIINRPTLFLEVLLQRKNLSTPGGRLIYSSKMLNIREIRSKLFVIDILDFSFIKPILLGKGFINQLYFKNKEKIKKALDIIGCDDFVTYESSPLTRSLVEYLEPRLKVFDGVDNFCKHESYAPLNNFLVHEYNEIIKTYEKVFFNSKDSLDFFHCKRNDNVEFMANGVDCERFQQDYSVPSNYIKSKSLGRNIAVYAGKMQSMFDVNLARDLAKQFPQVDFFYLGKILTGSPNIQLLDCENINFIGDIHYDLLPSFITNSDICIIPYRVEKQHGGDPIKFYEYYASGKPIVTTCIGDIQKYHDNESVFVVNRDDFCVSFELALASVHREKRAIPEEMSWTYKAEYMFIE